MAIQTKAHLDEGARLSRGYGDRRQTQRVIPVYAWSIPDNASAIPDAIAAAVTKVGQSITDDGATIPLADADCQLLGPAIDGLLAAIVYLKYGFTESDPPLHDTFNFVQEESFGERSSGTWKIVNISTGVATDAPTGTAFTLDSGEVLTRLSVDAPLHEILAPVVSTTNMVDTVATLYGHYNSDAVVIDGVERAAYTLKFRGVRQNPVDKRSGKVYSGFYVFHYFPGVYGGYDVYAKSTSSGTEYRLEVNTPSPAAAFTNAFPTSQGTGPKAAP